MEKVTYLKTRTAASSLLRPLSAESLVSVEHLWCEQRQQVGTQVGCPGGDNS